MIITLTGKLFKKESHMSTKKELFHGSDLEKVAQQYGMPKETIVSFAGNVNPLGVPPRLRETLIDHINVITTYPDREYTSLRESIATYVHSDTGNIIVGNGSTELISLFIQIKQPKKALIVGPTYSEYEREVALGGGRAYYIRLKESDFYKLNIEIMEDELKDDVDLLVLCNPNNPTSSLVNRNDMRYILDICKQKDIFVMVDETYVEFSLHTDEITAVPLTKYYNNVAILRGVSKFFAAPGLRLGYAVCGNHDLLKEMHQRKKPWTINSLAAVAGEILFSDTEYVYKTKSLIANEQKRICKLLLENDKYKVYPPNANFMLLRILDEETTSSDLFEKAIRNGLMIRDCSTFPFLNQKYIRFCFLMPEQNDRLMEVLM
jgi:threonine-phosphate decarboxylase